MARLFGDRFLPESVTTRRRSLRRRIRSLREPVRSTRESTVPGPNIIGTAENKLSGLRDRFVRRDALVSRLRSMTSSDEESEEENGEENGEEGESNSRGRQSTNTINT